MERTITGFHSDSAGEWIADLDCGHRRHVRHNPPWEDHAWVLEEESRRARLGTQLSCGLCDADSRSAYEDARLRGLCEEGAEEASRRKR